MSCKCDSIQIKDLRHSVTIQERTLTADGQGGSTESWSTFTTAWVAIEPTSAAQQFYAQHLKHRVTHKITARYFSGLTSDMRIIFGSRTFHVRGYRDLEERNRFYEIMAEEGAPS